MVPMAGTAYETEHIYELQVLGQFILWVGVNSNEVARHFKLPTSAEAKTMMANGQITQARKDEYGDERSEKLCTQIKKQLLTASDFPTTYWYKTDRSKPAMRELPMRLSSHVRDRGFLAMDPPQYQNTEFVYLDAKLNKLKGQLFGLKVPTVKHGWRNKLAKLAEASDLFVYLNEQHVVNVWGAVSQRVHAFYQELDDSKTDTIRKEWVVGKIQWATEYAQWEQRYLAAIEKKWRAWFVREMIAAMTEIEKEAKNSNTFKFLADDLKKRGIDTGTEYRDFGKLSVNRISLGNLRAARGGEGMETD
jgi:hypothetical protein